MNDFKRDAIERRNREFTATKSQRRRINALLRNGYDDAKVDHLDEDFQVTVYTADLPTPLTDANEIHFAKESTLSDMERLFGHIATHTTVHIDSLKPGYRISLLREMPGPDSNGET